jgi:hypothetical protein
VCIVLVVLMSVHHDARLITRNVHHYIFIYNNYAPFSISHTKWLYHILRRIWTAEHCNICTDHLIYGIAPLFFFPVSSLALRKHFSCFLSGYPSSFGFSCHDINSVSCFNSYNSEKKSLLISYYADLFGIPTRDCTVGLCQWLFIHL